MHNNNSKHLIISSNTAEACSDLLGIPHQDQCERNKCEDGDMRTVRVLVRGIAGVCVMRSNTPGC